MLPFIHSDEGLTLETSTSLSVRGGNVTPINLFDSTMVPQRFNVIKLKITQEE